MSGPLRVAIVCDYLLDYLGGAQTALLEQARALAAADHQVIVIAPGRASAAVLPEPGVGRVVGLRLIMVQTRATLPGLRLPVIRNTAALRSRLRHWLTDHRIDVVHLHSEFGLAAAAVDVASQLGLPVVHTVHTFFWRTGAPAQRALGAVITGFHRWVTGWPADRPPRLADRSGDAALRAMTWRSARRATAVISPSAHQADRLRAAGIDRVEVIPNTITGQPEATEPPLPYRPVKIIWLGRCAAEKRILPFVRAAVTAIERTGPDRLRVTVAGAGEQLRAARRIAARTPEIDLVGAVAHHDVQRLLRAHHLLALTSYGFDNQPMSIVEAITAGRGVLYCDPRLTEGTTGDDGPAAGLLAAGPDEAALADLLVDVAGDPDRVAAAGRAARRLRMIFEPETFLTRLTSLYRTIGRTVG